MDDCGVYPAWAYGSSGSYSFSVFPAIANSGGSQNDDDKEWNSTDRTLDGRRLDDGTRGERGVAAVRRIRNISGTGDRSVHQLVIQE